MMAASTFSVAAAGLFPVLVLGIWWRRTTRAGAIAGLLAGLVVTISYIGGSQLAPVGFYEMTGTLSDAGPTAGKKLSDLMAVAEKASPDGKSSAETAVLAYARGTSFKAGAANWLGIHNSAAAVFGLPIGFLIIILVSLLTRRPSPEALEFAEAIRRPPAVLQAD
jgi:cation/acetate symporter